MTKIVPAAAIEAIVGAQRHVTLHIGRAIFADQTVYILHSDECRDTTPDLRTCLFSRALDLGIDENDWTGQEDTPVALAVDEFGFLIPAPDQAR